MIMNDSNCFNIIHVKYWIYVAYKQNDIKCYL